MPHNLDEEYDTLEEAIAATTDESAEEIREAASEIELGDPWDGDVVEE